jgi:signal transduction histidine kinase
VVVDDEDGVLHVLFRLSAGACLPNRGNVRRDQRDAYDVWLSGELLLFGLLGAALALFVDYPGLRHAYDLPALRLVLDTAITLAGAIVAVLAGIRFSVEGRRFDLVLSCGFFVAAAATLVFGISPVLDGPILNPVEAWAGIFGSLAAAGLIALAPVVRGGVKERQRALGNAVAGLLVLLLGVWMVLRWIGDGLPALSATPTDPDPPALLTTILSLQALLSLLALIGFGLRYRNRGDDLDRWLASAATLSLFSSLYRVFTPLLSSTSVSIGDFLKVIAYGVLLVGVWRAISAAEFGRAVADERARVARDIHDGLAQYLFALATHASMLQAGHATPDAIAQIKELAVSAQQEARFAVLALSSAGGTAPFDAALRRYVEFLTADGALEVDVEIDQRVHLAPDEQIEVFRIVQEGLANVRKHANARRAEVRLGYRDGQRVVTVRDDGSGFEAVQDGAGQGLKNIRARAATIAGAATVRSLPGRGTTLEVALRS